MFWTNLNDLAQSSQLLRRHFRFVYLGSRKMHLRLPGLANTSCSCHTMTTVTAATIWKRILLVHVDRKWNVARFNTTAKRYRGWEQTLCLGFVCRAIVYRNCFISDRSFRSELSNLVSSLVTFFIPNSVHVIFAFCPSKCQQYTDGECTLYLSRSVMSL